MKNGTIEQFLESGWYSEATLFFNGYTYWCEGNWLNDRIDKKLHFTVQKYKSLVVDSFHTKCIVDKTGAAIDFEYVIDAWFIDEDEAKKFFLESKIFNNKTFWEVEDELAWYDEIGFIQQ